MIEAKEAVQIAMAQAAEMLNLSDVSIEEIERDSYKDRDVWSITLGFPRELSPFSATADPLKYKRFLVDVESGELVAIKLREVAVG